MSPSPNMQGYAIYIYGTQTGIKKNYELETQSKFYTIPAESSPKSKYLTLNSNLESETEAICAIYKNYQKIVYSLSPISVLCFVCSVNRSLFKFYYLYSNVIFSP